MTKNTKVVKQNKNELSTEIFNLSKLTGDDMTLTQQKKYIDDHFIILDNGNFALISEGKISIVEKSNIKSLYFNRMSKELNTYFFKTKNDIHKVICNPLKPRITETTLNLCQKQMPIRKPFKDYPEKIRSAVDLMNKYVLDILCKKDIKVFDHLMKMCSRMVRCIKNDACIYLKGVQGCGKSTFPIFLRIYVMGEDLSLETGSDPLRSKFNKELLSKVHVMFEELENFGTNDWLYISSKLKRWITSDVLAIEGKNEAVIQVENLITFWLLSNNDAIQDDDGRRYFILPVSTERMNDREYFGKIRDECYNDAVGEAYYNYLLEIDIEGFNSQNYPITETKLDSIAKRLDNVYKFLKEKYVLKERGIVDIKVQTFYEQYVTYCNENQLKSKNKIDFNKMLEDVNILRHKSNSHHFYRESYESLKALSDKFHWVHSLDEVSIDDNDDDCDEENIESSELVQTKLELAAEKEKIKYLLSIVSKFDIPNNINDELRKFQTENGLLGLELQEKKQKIIEETKNEQVEKKPLKKLKKTTDEQCMFKKKVSDKQKVEEDITTYKDLDNVDDPFKLF